MATQQFRGRPAGYYEVLTNADHVGAIVQRLSNVLDAGDVLAYGAVQVHPHSYRHTLDTACSAKSGGVWRGQRTWTRRSFTAKRRCRSSRRS
jgi:methionyl-tRNA formyltransferase